MKYQYTLHFSVETGKVLPTLGTVLDEVNKHMHNFGFPETMLLRSTCLKTVITSPEEFTPAALNVASSMVLSEIKKLHPEWNARLESTESSLILE